MKPYTVIYMFDSNGQVGAEHFDAEDAMHAIAQLAQMSPAALIIGAIEGTHQLVAPCEESGVSAYAIDIDW